MEEDSIENVRHLPHILHFRVFGKIRQGGTMEQKAIQIGTAVLALALLLRLGCGDGRAAWEVGNTLAFISTGRIAVQPELPTETGPPQEEILPPETSPEEPTEKEAAVPVFGEAQQALVKINAAWSVDVLPLLQEPLVWDLKQEKPTVLILHTHATESYENTAGYQESGTYRTKNTDYNMVSIGTLVAEMLEAGGVRVIHDKTLHDSPSYNSAYVNARTATAQTLEENPSICLVLDLHRDAAEDGTGKQRSSRVTIDGVSTANLMLVMGSDKGGLSFPGWEENLALAVKLQALLEERYPGLCKPIKLVSSRYNQDLCDGTLLVEVGMAGNTHDEALAAAKLLAEGILALTNGANS